MAGTKATVIEKSAARKAQPKAKTAATKRIGGDSCSVKGCTHPALRRGMCSGKGTNRHYRAWLKEQRAENA